MYREQFGEYAYSYLGCKGLTRCETVVNMMQARKYVIGLVMSVKQRRNLNSARGVELEIFGFGTPMLYLDFFHTRVPIQTLTALQISDSSLYKISKSNTRK